MTNEMMDDWLRPIGLSGIPEWTQLGTLDGEGQPILDPNGLVQVAPGSPGVDWWIAGDDRWYFPSQEKTVRQSLFKSTPVVETRMRIKGGDVCHRAYGARLSDAREVVVLEVENATGVPCGVAFAIRPFGVAAHVPLHRISIEEGVVSVDGKIALILPRAPAGSLGGSAATGDLSVRVRQGEAVSPTFAPVHCSDGFAQGVVVVPIAHRTSFRVILPMHPHEWTHHEAMKATQHVLPSAQNVADGWRAQVRNAARVLVPDPRLQAVLDAAPTWLLAMTAVPEAATGRSIWDPSGEPRWDRVAACAGALDRFGLSERSGLLLARATNALMEDQRGSLPRDVAWLVFAYAEHLTRTGDATFARAVLEATLRIADSLERDDPFLAYCLVGAEVVLRLAGEARAARSAARSAAPLHSQVAPEQLGWCTVNPLVSEILHIKADRNEAAFEKLDQYLDAVSSTGVWAEPESTPVRHVVGTGASVVCLALDLLVSSQENALQFLSYVPENWFGKKMAIHDVATPLGVAGCAVRWHQNRPVLLFEVRSAMPLTVQAPGLDEHWLTSESEGEALLAERPVRASSGARIVGLQIAASGPRPRST